MSTASASSGSPFRAILEVGTALTSSLDLDEVLTTVAEKIGEAMSVYSVDINTYDVERDELTPRATWSLRGLSKEERAYLGVPIDMRTRPEWKRIIVGDAMIEFNINDADLPEEDRVDMKLWGFKTTFEAPLRSGGEPIGSIALYETRFVRHFAPMEQDIFKELCELAANAISNGRLYRLQQEQHLHMAALLDAGHTLTSTLEPDEVLARVVREAGDTLNVPRAAVYEHDTERDALVYRVCQDRDGVEWTSQAPGTIIPLSDAIAEREILNATDIVLEYVADSVLDERRREQIEKWGAQAILSAPLRVGTQALGILRFFEFDQARLFSASELDFARGLAERASIAINNAVLYGRLDVQQGHLRSLLSAGSSIIATEDPTDVFSAIVRVAAEALESARAAVYEFDAQSDTVTRRAIFPQVQTSREVVAGDPGPVDEIDRCREVLEVRQPSVAYASGHDTPAELQADMLSHGEHVRLTVPMLFLGQPLGLLVFAETDGERTFTAEEIDLALGIAEHAAAAISNARLRIAFEVLRATRTASRDDRVVDA